MTQGGDELSAEAYRQAAELVDAHSYDILASYEANLRNAGHVIADSSEALSQAKAHAEEILADIITSLREGRVRVGPRHQFLARAIGATRAANGVHPQESLKAASLFFGATLSILSGLLSTSTDPLGAFSLAALALERSISVRIREAMNGYTDFLLNKVSDAQLEERRRIARELHDRLGHGISAAYRNLELFELYHDTDPVKAILKAENAEKAIKETMQNLRAVTSDLYSKEMAKGLEKALLHYLETAEVFGIDIFLQMGGGEHWAQPAVLDEVFLMVREASHNALRHAGASAVLVKVTITPHELRASVEDDGCGFDPARLSESGGVGLSSMRERAGMLDGTMQINSRKGVGTQVDFLIPLKGVAES